MIDYPPILQGSAYLQLSSLRDYLVRMAEELRAVSVQAGNSAQALSGETVSGVRKSLSAAMADGEAGLKSLIKKTAAVIESHVDSIETSLQSDYVARSEFGEYTRQASAELSATAEGVTEAYTLAESVSQSLSSLSTELQGEIRRGVIRDPETDQDVIGIAISQKLYFEEHGLPFVDAGSVFWHRLSPGQSFALYTATGWQYWINGRKVGWFSSQDSSLHFSEAAAEKQIRFGNDWVLEADGTGFGVRFIG